MVGGVITRTGAGDDRATALLQLKSGHLLVVGWRAGSGNEDFMLQCYTEDGKSDTHFGSGNGIAFGGVSKTIKIPAKKEEPKKTSPSASKDIPKDTTVTTVNNDRAYATLQQKGSGKLMVAGSTSSGANASDFVLMSFNANGSLNTAFAGKGWVTTNIAGGMDAAYAMIEQSDGKLVLAGEATVKKGVKESNDFALARYNANGTLDKNFGSKGAVTTNLGSSHAVINALIQQADGKLVAVGYSKSLHDGRSIAVVRYNKNGSLDKTFGRGGIQLTDIHGANDEATAVVQQPEGKLLVAGTSNGDFVLLRYNSDGALDTSLHGDGIVVTPVGSAVDAAYSMFQQANGQVLVAGTSAGSASTDFAVVRYLFDDNDNDGVLNDQDNCRSDKNVDQTDTDKDGIGDACDADKDNDGAKNEGDAFPLNRAAAVDTDADGEPDSWNTACDDLCQKSSGLTLDIDNDNDDLGNDVDPFPQDPYLINRVTGDRKAGGLGYSVATLGDIDMCCQFWTPNLQATANVIV